jgi:hypothetical protein
MSGFVVAANNNDLYNPPLIVYQIRSRSAAPVGQEIAGTHTVVGVYVVPSRRLMGATRLKERLRASAYNLKTAFIATYPWNWLDSPYALMKKR